MTSSPTVYVYLPSQGYVPAGILAAPAGGEVTFRYGRNYPSRPSAFPLDPIRFPFSLKGFAFAPRGHAMFNVFRDAAPDNWGRKILSLLAGRSAESMTELEILTAFHFPARIGALAFGPTPSSGPQSMAPYAADRSWPGQAQSMADLARIARAVTLVEGLEDDEALEQFRRDQGDDALLKALASSVSLGGGRPKVHVRLDGRDYIAKFRRLRDPWNEVRIEHAAMTLASACGVAVAPTLVVEVEGQDVLLVERFDRGQRGEPRHFVSGFTVRDANEDGDWGSYQDLAEAARKLGDASAGEELFRRMVMNAILSNTDDHLRNHAFFVDQSGVSLTPAFDVVPTRITLLRYQLALVCGAEGTVPTKENLLSVTRPFGLRPTAARDILEGMFEAAQYWPDHFRSAGVSERDIRKVVGRFGLLHPSRT